MKLAIHIKGKRIELINVLRCKNKALGLMFSSREHHPLLFQFGLPGNYAIHSFFVFYPFLAIWINNGRVVDYKIVKPFSFLVKPKSDFTDLIEIPLNEKSKELLDLVGR